MLSIWHPIKIRVHSKDGPGLLLIFIQAIKASPHLRTLRLLQIEQVVLKHLLRFARNEPSERRVIDLAPTIERVANLCRPYAASRDGTIRIEVPPRKILVSANPVEIEESLINNFRAMGTTSRDDLIRQFKQLTSAELSDEHCEFFLDSSICDDEPWLVIHGYGFFRCDHPSR